MTWRASKKPFKPALVSTRAEWRTFVAEGRKCATDATNGLNDAAAQLRLMALSAKANAASSKRLEQDAGASVAEVARAFMRLCAAMSRSGTPGLIRVSLAPVIEAAGKFLDDQMHDLNTGDFQRAHANRPEVFG